MGENEMFCKVNFITWNYDLNLITSIKNYFFPNLTFKEMMVEIGYENPIWNIKNQISIINMNGFFYSSVFDNVKDIYNLDVFELLKNRMVYNYFDDNYFAEDAELIKFAWETNLSIPKLNVINHIIKKSKNIVIIGYTFPLYNRLIDSDILNSNYLRTKNLIFQDPNAENIMEDFELYFSHVYEVIGRKKITNCAQFFIPSNIIVKIED